MHQNLTSDVYLINKWSNYTLGNLELTWQLTNVELVLVRRWMTRARGSMKRTKARKNPIGREIPALLDRRFMQKLSAGGGADENLLK